MVIGGGSLLLRGWIDRPTTDLDIPALGPPAHPSKARPLPAELADAVVDVADVVGLPTSWMNAGPTDLLDLGLPPGFASRTAREEFGGLVVHLAGRLDLIATKLYAAVDRGPHSKHVTDLRALDADETELRFGARWARTHDPSAAFAAELLQAL